MIYQCHLHSIDSPVEVTHPEQLTALARMPLTHYDIVLFGLAFGTSYNIYGISSSFLETWFVCHSNMHLEYVSIRRD